MTSSIPGLEGRTAVITGAASGIGRATARLFADAGAAVVVADLNAEGAEQTATDIGKQGGTALAVAGDLSDPAVITRLVAETNGRFGGTDILINNAGVTDSKAPPARVSDQEWERNVRINLTAPFLLTRAVLPHMLRQQHGVIVNVASEAGLRGGAAGIAYTAAKHGVVGMTKSLAAAYRLAGIRANAIAPGPVRTGITATAAPVDPEGRDLLAPVLEMGITIGVAEAEQIASVARFLASDAADNINGAIIPADGGWAAL
ncbi:MULTISPECIES: SDR family NAD(P)-dependent oxidoreductase [unclassified Streptomyces]|uniref:SDR family NAD(P)-dependent oxidoreductase n=1 Tax=unclassified Streptomyces TaxID=2593676 RepID=UPI002E16D6E4|nr:MULTISPECIES: SDR family NAD(P)-dependent oxidoreductase [unclassified Streptomyces]